jgi:hypothetical protein
MQCRAPRSSPARGMACFFFQSRPEPFSLNLRELGAVFDIVLPGEWRVDAENAQSQAARTYTGG